MPNLRWTPSALPALALGAALFVGACNSTSSTAPGTTAALTQADANAASDVIVSDAANLVEGATSTDVATAFSLQGGAAVLQPAFAGFGGWYGTACTPAPTVTTTGNTTSIVYDNCTITRPMPLETIVRNGEVDITRETGARTVVFKALSRSWTRVSFRTGATITSSETRNGTRHTSNDGTTLTHQVFGLGDPATTFFTTDYVHDDGKASKHERNWQATFTADVAGGIVHDQPLPAGNWNITGQSTWTRQPGTADQKQWSFSTSAQALHYNPACDKAPQFDSGTMTVTASNPQKNTTSTFTITFTACGQYTTTITKTTTT